jgi:sarcosine oxidase
MGSATCFELARRGRRVLGLEQFPLVHARGSSHGHTRIIRTAYYEHPDYVPLVRRSFELWYALEQRTGRHLLTSCPCLNIGPTGGDLVAGVLASANQHGLTVEKLSDREIRSRYPFQFPEGNTGVLELAAGFLAVEDCVRSHIDGAVALGAEIHSEEPVLRWAISGNAVAVTTGRATYHAASLIVTAGAWATQLLADLGVPLTVMRQVLLWFDVGCPSRDFRRDVFPIFLADVPGGPFYGLPAIDRNGLKLARHYGAPHLLGPDGVNWDVSAEDEAVGKAFLNQHLPGLTWGMTKGQVCMYTLTPDRHFVLDVHPTFPQVVVGCGFSGHGFKFAPVVGEILADLAESGRTAHPIDLFAARRFAVGRLP